MCAYVRPHDYPSADDARKAAYDLWNVECGEQYWIPGGVPVRWQIEMRYTHPGELPWGGSLGS